MLFNCVVIISNLIKRINFKFIRCSCKLNVKVEGPLQKNSFPDIDIMYRNLKEEIHHEFRNEIMNKKNDQYIIDFEEISVWDESQEVTKNYYNFEVANKEFYYIY